MYKDPEKQATYQREWVAKRRAEYLSHRKCERCKRAKKNLSFLALPGQTFNHRCWTWNESRRNIELLKAWVLCPGCKKRTLAERFAATHPTLHGTERAYGRGCHCAACRGAHARANNARKQRRVNKQGL